MLSLIVPVYRNERSLPALLEEIERVAAGLSNALEVVFVVDGSPDHSLDVLRARLPTWSLPSRLVELSRNFGSFSAIAAGLEAGSGDYFAVLAADLQEPPELVVEFQRILSSGADVVLGYRTGRADPPVSRWLSNGFWEVYRRFVVTDMPEGGVDVFGCTRQVRDRLVAMKELNTNLIALILWLGFRREFVPYERRARVEGKSAWTFSRKLQYALDSIFNFTDLPIRILLVLGAVGTTAATVAGLAVVVAWTLGRIPVLGYTPLVLLITLFGGLTTLGLGIVGQYLWLSLQNGRQRPNFIVRTSVNFEGRAHARQNHESAERSGEIVARNSS
jgi:glycosyltransferase involved in cell wall biosynthesis